MGHVLVAPDKFKGSADRARGRGPPGIRAAGRRGGGRGAAGRRRRGRHPRRRRRRRVPAGPGRGERPDRGLRAHAFAVRDGTAVVELAAASGLVLLPDGPDPLGATSRGTGELIRAALDAGATRIVLGVGGSACTDGGAGMLAALGARFLDDAGGVLPDGGGALARLATVDLSGLDPRLAGRRDRPGQRRRQPAAAAGAAAVYGPQKGASASDIALLERGLARLRRARRPAAAPAPRRRRGRRGRVRRPGRARRADATGHRGRAGARRLRRRARRGRSGRHGGGPPRRADAARQGAGRGGGRRPTRPAYPSSRSAACATWTTRSWRPRAS